MSYDTIIYRGFTINIEQDEEPMNPRTDWEPAGHLVCFHSRYDLGDKHDFTDPDALREYMAENKAVHLPVYLLDHSGLRMNTGGFGCPWDSGQVGVIYMLPEEVQKWGTAHGKTSTEIRLMFVFD